MIGSAQAKIKQIPGKIPLTEHREFHLLFYRKLNNEYLNGIFEAYWDLYRIEGLEIYSDLLYADKVWQYHARIIDQVRLVIACFSASGTGRPACSTATSGWSSSSQTNGR